MNVLGWIVIGVVIAFVLWRIWNRVTARYRVGRKMFEGMSDNELEALDQDWLRQEGLEGIYQEELKKRGMRKD